MHPPFPSTRTHMNKFLLTTQLNRLALFCQSEQQDFLLTASKLKIIPVWPQSSSLWMNQIFCPTKASSKSGGSAILKQKRNPTIKLLILVLASKCFQSEVFNPEIGPHKQDLWAGCCSQTWLHSNPENPTDVSTTRLSEPPSSEEEWAELKSSPHTHQCLIALHSSTDGMSNPLLKAREQSLWSQKQQFAEAQMPLLLIKERAWGLRYNSGKSAIKSQAAVGSVLVTKLLMG